MIEDDLYRRCVGSTALAEEVCRRYGLGRLRGWQDLGGSWTTNLRLDVDAGPRVARIHRDWTTPERLAGLQQTRRAVAAAGIPAVQPLPDPSGSPIVRLDSGRLVELEPFVTWDRRMNTPPQLRSGFTLLAELHDVLRTADLPEVLATVPYANHLHSAEAAGLTRAGAERMRGWGDRRLAAYADAVVEHIDAVTTAESVRAGDQRTQLVHGDFWDNNVLFAGDRLAAVIDFDFMAARWRVDDLALTLWFWLLEPDRGLPGHQDRLLIRGLLDRYDAAATTPLSTAERLQLPLAIARQPAWSVGRWVLIDDDEQAARRHAHQAATELPVATTVLQQLDQWWRDLID